jgi:two-component sensor histidine kinase
VRRARGSLNLLYFYLLSSLFCLALLLPFAKLPGPQLFGITPLFCGGTFVAEVITAVLLLARFKENRRRSFLVLASGNAYTAAVIVGMVLCFPDALESGTAIIGRTTDLAAWAFQLWGWGIAVFPLLAVREELRGSLAAEDEASSAAVALVAPVLLVAALVGIGRLLDDRLPALLIAGRWTQLNLALTGASYLFIVASIAVIFVRLRDRDRVWLWLAASLTIFLAANVVSTYSGMRFAVGWSMGRLLLLLANSGLLIYFLTLFRDQQLELAASRDQLEARVAERTARLETLLNELNHRVKNTLATVQAIVRLSLRTEGVDTDVQRAIDSRLLALSRAHNSLNRESWRNIPLREIILDSVEPFDPNRMQLRGKDIRIDPKSALAIAMAVHELGTNALKFGALSQGEGTVSIKWSQADDRLHLEWRESGGPSVEYPSYRGFGSKLLQRSIAQDLGGDVALRYEKTGLVCILSGDISAAAREGVRGHERL